MSGSESTGSRYLLLVDQFESEGCRGIDAESGRQSNDDASSEAEERLADRQESVAPL